MDSNRSDKEMLNADHKDLESDTSSVAVERKTRTHVNRITGLFIWCLISLPFLVTVAVVCRDFVPVGVSRYSETSLTMAIVTNGSLSRPAHRVKDKLLGGLLVEGFEEKSCLSRYQSTLYAKESPHKPSPYLLKKLREHEERHRKCGPHTDSYRIALEQLKSGNVTGSTDCKYAIWSTSDGLGNRMITLASTFLYALLTDRILMVERLANLPDIFCEPFLGSSWSVPTDFPYREYNEFHQGSKHCYGNMLKNKIIDDENPSISAESLPSMVYVHLTHTFDEYDKLFFCPQDQEILRKIPWVIMRSNNYFTPFFFLVPTFEQELKKMFPDKNTVFHHLGRYLFHPTNPVWGLVTRSYEAYMEDFDEKVGIQIRTFDSKLSQQQILDQILDCTLNQKLLPQVNQKEPIIISEKKKKIAVIMTSLSSWYFENIQKMYYEHPTVTGDLVRIYQPTHEETQQTEKSDHNVKALAEIYLLSMTDTLVTSAWSTFGYVAQGLGGIKPWIMLRAKDDNTIPKPSCRRALSMELCFHAAPEYYCKDKNGINTGTLLPHLRHCEDVPQGLKLVGPDEL